MDHSRPTTTRTLAAQDLAHVLEHARVAFESLRGARLFITGGTGFFGHWLLESLLHANAAMQLQARATVLTRDAARFRAKSPHIADHAAIELVEGDAATFAFPQGQFTHVLHAATDSGGQQAALRPGALAESIVGGTNHVLDFAEAYGAKRFLYTSTGAVYGRSTTLLHTPESYAEDRHIELPADSYESAKRMAEQECFARASVGPVVARCFAFVGPHLPLDQHFAIGNFIGAAMQDKTLHIKGDGTPRRSWMYMADLAAWLWTMLARGEAGRAYNVGSDAGMTIAEAALLTAATLRPGLGVQIDGTPVAAAPLNSYVPDVSRAREELGLDVRVPIQEALRRTAAWYEPEGPLR
jgi:nucleoside-diphosphate-sugar epimerase